MAYLLDTNILSELRKKDRAAAPVVAWYAGVDDADLFLSVLVLGEVRRGVELRWRHDPAAAQSLERWLDGITRWYQHRILPVTTAVAGCWGSLCVDHSLPVIDGLLAATALQHDLVFVTRNVDDVAKTGVRFAQSFLVRSHHTDDTSLCRELLTRAGALHSQAFPSGLRNYSVPPAHDKDNFSPLPG